jgi:hypothetical protein
MPKKRTPFSLPRTRKQFIPWLIATILLLAVGASQLDPSATPKLINVQPGYYRVVEFFDGDTIAVDINGANEKIRLIGVDNPKTPKPLKVELNPIVFHNSFIALTNLNSLNQNLWLYLYYFLNKFSINPFTFKRFLTFICPDSCTMF